MAPLQEQQSCGAVGFALGSFQATTFTLTSGGTPPALRVEQGSAWPASWRQTVGSRELKSSPLLAFPRIGSVLSEPEATEQKLVTSGLGQSRIKARIHSLKVWATPPCQPHLPFCTLAVFLCSARPGPHGPLGSPLCLASGAPVQHSPSGSLLNA